MATAVYTINLADVKAEPTLPNVSTTDIQIIVNKLFLLYKIIGHDGAM